MNTQNTLIALKEIAIDMVDYVPDERHSLSIVHPFFTDEFFSYDGRTYSVFIDSSAFTMYKKHFIEQVIKKVSSVDEMAELFQYHFLLLFLQRAYAEDILQSADCGRILLKNWQNIRLINHEDTIAKYMMLFWIEEYKGSENNNTESNEPVTIFRGYKKKGMTLSLSWTLDREVARAYALRSDMIYHDAIIAEAHILQKDILKTFETNKEVVVDYNKVFDVVEHRLTSEELLSKVFFE